MGKKRDCIVSVIFFLYCAAMVCLLFARSEPADEYPYWQQVRSWTSLVPFHTIRKQLGLLADPEKFWLFRHALVNLGGNTVLFMPMGIFLPRLCRKLNSFRKVLLAGTGIIIGIELTQVLTLVGRCDIDDLILNLIGIAAGYGIYKWLWTE